MCTGPHDFIPAVNTAKAEMRLESAGQRVLNILHFQKVAGWDSAGLVALAQALEDAWVANIKPLVPATVTLREVYVRDIEVEEGVEHTLPSLEAGTAEQLLLPNNVTIALSLRTGFSGRSNRGRVYWVGLTENQVVNSTLEVGAQASILGAFQDFISDASAETSSSLVVVSYCEDNQWRTNAQVTEVTNITLTDPTTDSMRRRLPGRGL